MKISARNKIEAKVSDIKKGLVNAEIDLELAGGQKLAAVITLTSAQKLGIETGKTVFAIIKASNIMIAESVNKISARNQVNCKVSEVKEGKVNAEIDLNASGTGTELVSIITLESAKNLGLVPGKDVTAIIKASDIIIGVE